MAISPSMDPSLFSIGGDVALYADFFWGVVVATLYKLCLLSPTLIAGWAISKVAVRDWWRWLIGLLVAYACLTIIYWAVPAVVIYQQRPLGYTKWDWNVAIVPITECLGFGVIMLAIGCSIGLLLRWLGWRKRQATKA